MEFLARAFDHPIDSREHRDLAESVRMGGELVTIRYWLGRLLDRNFFRESDDAVNAALRQYFIDRGFEKGAPLALDYEAWTPLAVILQHQAELNAGSRPTKSAAICAALCAVMVEPELTNAQLAELAKTTEKQVARMSAVFVLQRLWRLHRTETPQASGP